MDKEIYRLARETASLQDEVDKLNEDSLRLNIFMIKAQDELKRLKAYIKSLE